MADLVSFFVCFYRFEICRNQEIQRRMQEEIDEAFGDQDSVENFDYNTVQNLPYLDMVIHEALRLHSPVGVLSRAVVKDYRQDTAALAKVKDALLNSLSNSGLRDQTWS